MDWIDHHFLNQLRRRLPTPIFQVPRNLAVRRRLYGVLLLAGAAALGIKSSEKMKQLAIEDWSASHSPGFLVWRAIAESRGLHSVLELQKWGRHMPQNTHPRAVWWDAELQALWVFPEGSEEQAPYLFSAVSRPAAARSSPQFLGQGWTALQALQSLETVHIRSPKQPRAHQFPRDPREWNF